MHTKKWLSLSNHITLLLANHFAGVYFLEENCLPKDDARLYRRQFKPAGHGMKFPDKVYEPLKETRRQSPGEVSLQ